MSKKHTILTIDLQPIVACTRKCKWCYLKKIMLPSNNYSAEIIDTETGEQNEQPGYHVFGMIHASTFASEISKAFTELYLTKIDELTFSFPYTLSQADYLLGMDSLSDSLSKSAEKVAKLLVEAKHIMHARSILSNHTAALVFLLKSLGLIHENTVLSILGNMDMLAWRMIGDNMLNIASYLSNTPMIDKDAIEIIAALKKKISITINSTKELKLLQYPTGNLDTKNADIQFMITPLKYSGQPWKNKDLHNIAKTISEHTNIRKMVIETLMTKEGPVRFKDILTVRSIFSKYNIQTQISGCYTCRTEAQHMNCKFNNTINEYEFDGYELIKFGKKCSYLHMMEHTKNYKHYVKTVGQQKEISKNV